MAALPRLSPEIESHLLAWYLVRLKCNLNAVVQVDQAEILGAKKSRSNQEGNASSPRVLAGLLTGFVAIEASLALLLVRFVAPCAIATNLCVANDCALRS